ncbi:hypothetical protein [Intestinirhabdus alba]
MNRRARRYRSLGSKKDPERSLRFTHQPV